MSKKTKNANVDNATRRPGCRCGAACTCGRTCTCGTV